MLKYEIKHRAFLILLALAINVALGCSSTAVRKRTVEVNAPEDRLKTFVLNSESLQKKIDSVAFAHFVNGVISEQARDFYSASKSYAAALQRYPRSYEIRFSLANVFYLMQMFNEALETLEEIYPEDINVRSLRGICNRSVGDNKSARDAYVKVVELDPHNSIAFSFLASEYRRLNLIDSLVWAYEHLLKIDDRDHRLWVELGRLQSIRGEYEDAKAAFQNSLALASGRNNLSAYLGLGDLYERINQPDSAVTIYKDALQYDPNNSHLIRALANYYSQRDSLDIALHYAEQLDRLQPTNIAAKRFLARLYVMADSVLKAEQILNELVDAGDNEPANYFYLGRIAIMKQDFETAKEKLTLLTQLADTLADGWLDLGLVYRRTEENDKAINVYQSGLRFVNNKDDSLRLMFSLGALYERTGQIEKAAETFEQLLVLSPDHSQTLNYLGYMLADRGEQLTYAQELIEKALEFAPENPAYIDSYGWVLYRQGKYEKSVDYLEKAVALQDDPIIYDHLGDAYKAVGKSEDARKWWHKALELEPNNDSIREKLNE